MSIAIFNFMFCVLLGFIVGMCLGFLDHSPEQRLQMATIEPQNPEIPLLQVAGWANMPITDLLTLVSVKEKRKTKQGRFTTNFYTPEEWQAKKQAEKAGANAN